MCQKSFQYVVRDPVAHFDKLRRLHQTLLFARHVLDTGFGLALLYRLAHVAFRLLTEFAKCFSIGCFESYLDELGSN
eukprot:3705037-Pyramimonas_sp.AAC.1